VKQIPYWKAKRFTACHEIPRILWNPEGSLPHTQEPIACRSPKPDQALPTNFFNQSLITLHLRLNLPSGFFTLGFPTKNICAALLQTLRAVCPVHHILPDIKTRIIFDGQYR
jgi:hypothetical protein